MKTLFTIDIRNYDPSLPHSERPSARAIIRAGDDRLALVHSRKSGYYKFPGGGIHDGEAMTDALIREVAEETGLTVVPGTIREYGQVRRLQASNGGKGGSGSTCPTAIFDQYSYYFECQVETLDAGRQDLDEYEADEGFELTVVPIAEAMYANTHLSTATDPFDLVMIARETQVLGLLSGVQPEMSRAMAEFLLEEGCKKNPGPWREHSYEVARAAEKIARAVADNGGALDPHKAYVYGLLHDIGRQEGVTYIRHVWDGYTFFNSLGYADIARICLTHSFHRQDRDDYIGKIDVDDGTLVQIIDAVKSVAYDDYDRLIQVLDGTCAADGTKDLEARMSDVKRRYGTYPEAKWNLNFEYKAYFEKLAGRSYYDMIR